MAFRSILLPTLGLLAFGCSEAPSAGGAGRDADVRATLPVEAEREMAPDFELTDLDGRPVHLAALRGKTVIIDFWATWCPPCEFQVPELNAFHEAHRNDADVEVIGISVDTEGPEVVSEWVAEKKVRYRIAIGSEDLARRYGAMGFPTLVIVRPDGTVDSRHVGLIETADLEQALLRQREV